MNTPAIHLRHHLQLFGMACLWGSTWSMGRVVVQAMPPLTAATVRIAIACLALLLALIAGSGLAPLQALRPRQWLGLALAAAFGVCGYAVCFMLALQHVPAGKAATVVALNPVPPMLLASWLFGERLNLRILTGMLLAVTGAMTAISHGHPLAMLSGDISYGEALLLTTVLCWTGYTLIGRVLLAGIAPLPATLATTFFGAWMLLAVATLLEGPQAWSQLAQAPSEAWLSLLGLALGGTSLAYLWYFAGIRQLGVGTAAGYMSLVPVFGILISSLWLDEALHASLLAGGVMVVTGMLMMNLGKGRT